MNRTLSTKHGAAGAVCEPDDRAALTILRDRGLVARGTAGYAYEQCG